MCCNHRKLDNTVMYFKLFFFFLSFKVHYNAHFSANLKTPMNNQFSAQKLYEVINKNNT